MAGEYLKVLAVVAAYWTISISMVFMNKHLLGDRDSGKDISLFVAWFQCVVSVVVILFRHVASGVVRNDWSKLQTMVVGAGPGAKGAGAAAGGGGPFVRPILKMTCTYVGMLTFNNLCLKNVGVAFYQVARSLTLIFVVVFSVVLLKKSVSWRVVACCLVVACGFVLGVDQESLSGTLSVGGVIFGVITSLFVSLNGIFTKTALEAVDRDSVKLTFYNNINAVLLFLPFVIFTGQFETVFESPEYQTAEFWVLLVLSGGLGFLIAWISAVQIDITSPVTHHISANAKAVCQTLLAVALGTEGAGSKGVLWWLSILMVVLGALFYALTRMQEEAAEKRRGGDGEEPKRRGEETDSNKNLLVNGAIAAEEGKVTR